MKFYVREMTVYNVVYVATHQRHRVVFLSGAAEKKKDLLLLDFSLLELNLSLPVLTFSRCSEFLTMPGHDLFSSHQIIYNF